MLAAQALYHIRQPKLEGAPVRSFPLFFGRKLVRNEIQADEPVVQRIPLGQRPECDACARRRVEHRGRAGWGRDRRVEDGGVQAEEYRVLVIKPVVLGEGRARLSVGVGGQV